MLLAKKFGQKTKSDVGKYQIGSRSFAAYNKTPSNREKIINYSATAEALKTSPKLDKTIEPNDSPPPMTYANDQKMNGMSGFIGNGRSSAKEFRNKNDRPSGGPAAKKAYARSIKGASLPPDVSTTMAQTVQGIVTETGKQTPRTGGPVIPSSATPRSVPTDPLYANSTLNQNNYGGGYSSGGGDPSLASKTVGYPSSNPTGAPLIKNPAFIMPQNIFTSKLNIVSPGGGVSAS